MARVAVILAAGLGTRMKSALPKAALKLGGRPMLTHLIASCAAVFDRIVVVVGPGMAVLEEIAAPHTVVVQAERLGTAHAALQAAAHFGDGMCAVFYADNPLIKPETIAGVAERLAAGDAGLVLLGMRTTAPNKYGRLVVADGYIQKLVEYADASDEEREIALCNAGAIAAGAADMARWLRAVRPDNAKGEYYLTDVLKIAQSEGVRAAAVEAPYAECLGINAPAELAAAEAALQTRLREAAMADGVAMLAPETVYFSADTVLAPDVTIGPYVVFGPNVRVESGVDIKAFSHLEDCLVQAGAVIGPYTRLRPGADIGPGAHVGNFVEIKAATLGAGAKANHLTYIGDAEIGPGTNIGAGTITCNYDGKNKHKTKIGAKVFIGSNTALVAPVSVGDGGFVAAGSTITEDVPAGKRGFGRARQVNK